MNDLGIPFADDLMYEQWQKLLVAGALESELIRFDATAEPGLGCRQTDVLESRSSARAGTISEDWPPSEVTGFPKIPDYAVLGELGVGGMGLVYKVRDLLGREYALKMARGDRLSERGKKRFQSEALAMSKLDHPNLAPVRHYGIYGDQPYFVMEVYSSNLSEKIEEYRNDQRRIVKLLRSIAEGVGYLHQKGFIHRDLKPSNVLLTEDGTPKVSDLGLVKNLIHDGSASESDSHSERKPDSKETALTARKETEAGTVVGTRSYMAPEQAAGMTDQASPRWDVFSLGVILHELLTGALPPSSKSPSNLLDRGSPGNPPISSFDPKIDRGLERIVAKCLAPQAINRFDNGAALAAALGSWEQGQSKFNRGLVFAAACLLMIVGVTLGITLNGSQNELSLSKGIAKLRAGEEWMIVPEKGLPNWGRPVFGSFLKPYASDETGLMHLDCMRMGMFELCPNPEIDEYRFELEVTQNSAPTQTIWYGAYVGKHSAASPHKSSDCFAVFKCNDTPIRGGETKRTGIWQASYQCLHITADGRDRTSDFAFKLGRFATKDQVPQRLWHKVAIDVSLKEIAFFVDGEQLATTPTQPIQHRQQFLTNAELNANHELNFTPRGGLGLFVHGCSAAFRNIKIVPKLKNH